MYKISDSIKKRTILCLLPHISPHFYHNIKKIITFANRFLQAYTNEH